jgi:hypothetical protein
MFLNFLERMVFDMKNKISLLGTVALILTVGFILPSCDHNGGDESHTGQKTIKITGYSSESGFVGGGEMVIFSELPGPDDDWQPAAIKRWKLADGILTDGHTYTYALVNWHKYTSQEDWDAYWANPEPWTETGKFYIQIDCETPKKDPEKDGSHYVYSEDGTNPTAVDIKNAVTTLEFS